MTFWKFQIDFGKCKKASFLHVFLQKINEYTHEFKKLIRAHQVLIISYQTPRKIMESVENCEFRGSGKFIFKSGAKFLETPIYASAHSFHPAG